MTDTIDFHGDNIPVHQDDGKVWVALKPICQALGIDFDSQRQKLKNKSWAVTVIFTATGSDGKNYKMLHVDRRTMTMWLATLNENQVAEGVREKLQWYQAEAADVLDDYFNGSKVVFNPRATHEELTTGIEKIDAARIQIEEAKAIKARAEAAHSVLSLPGMDPRDAQKAGRIMLGELTGQDFTRRRVAKVTARRWLRENTGVTDEDISLINATFSDRLRDYYQDRHNGLFPPRVPMPGRATRGPIYLPVEDHDLFDVVWKEGVNGGTWQQCADERRKS